MWSNKNAASQVIHHPSGPLTHIFHISKAQNVTKQQWSFNNHFDVPTSPNTLIICGFRFVYCADECLQIPIEFMICKTSILFPCLNTGHSTSKGWGEATNGNHFVPRRQTRLFVLTIMHRSCVGGWLLYRWWSFLFDYCFDKPSLSLVGPLFQSPHRLHAFVSSFSMATPTKLGLYWFGKSNN